MSEDTRRLLGDINRRLGRVERNGVHYRVNDNGDPTLVWQGGSVGFDGGSSTASGYYINVRNHGAVGDGTTDDTAAFKAALAAAEGAGNVVYGSRGHLQASPAPSWSTAARCGARGFQLRGPRPRDAPASP